MNMKKLIAAVCLTWFFAFMIASPVVACWAPPQRFEIFSADRSRVFVFTPGDDNDVNAFASVYDINGWHRTLVYEVKDLPYFSYRNNFFFSEDMMHFGRSFPGGGASAFEVYSYGERTRVIARDEFIRNHASIAHETTAGIAYTVAWSVDPVLTQGAVVTISTSEIDAISFNLASATFEGDIAFPVSAHISTFFSSVVPPGLFAVGSISVVIAIAAIIFYIRR